MFSLNCKGRLFVLDQPVVMGIINTTPDSFYEQSRYTGIDAIVQTAEQMLKDGADIIDIGGQSTRPGSKSITAEEELSRVIGGIEAIHKNFPAAIISIDSYYSVVVKEAVAAGASIVNDISGGGIDPAMIEVVGSLHTPYILMHMKGNPGNMQELAQYQDVTREVLDYFIIKIDQLHRAGIHDIIIDPGFGFAKTIEQNFELLRNLQVFKMLDCPLLLGISRKSTVYKTLGLSANESLNGTTVLNTIGLVNGASILRVHDVKEAREAIRLVKACMG